MSCTCLSSDYAPIRDPVCEVHAPFRHTLHRAGGFLVLWCAAAVALGALSALALASCGQ